jgi:hypothetical protein
LGLFDIALPQDYPVDGALRLNSIRHLIVDGNSIQVPIHTEPNFIAANLRTVAFTSRLHFWLESRETFFNAFPNLEEVAIVITSSAKITLPPMIEVATLVFPGDDRIENFVRPLLEFKAQVAGGRFPRLNILKFGDDRGGQVSTFVADLIGFETVCKWRQIKLEHVANDPRWMG